MKPLLATALLLCLTPAATPQAKSDSKSDSKSEDLLQERSPQYVTALPTATAPVSAGKSTIVKLRFRVKPGFHINSNAPRSELLIPTTLHLSPPSEIATGKTTYPAGDDLAFPFDPKQKLSVYSGEFTVSTKVVASQHAPSGAMTVHGSLRYQACNDNSCFPPKEAPLQFNIRVSPAPHVPRATGRGQSPHVKY